MAVGGRGRGGAGRLGITFAAIVIAGLACGRADEPPALWKLVEPWSGSAPTPSTTPTASATPHPLMTLFPQGGGLAGTPTPDPTRPLPEVRTSAEGYIVLPGDSLSAIARRYSISTGALMEANGILNPNYLSVGQYLTIPAPRWSDPHWNPKIIPDSELVYGPSTAFFDLAEEIESRDGRLAGYTEMVEGRRRSASEIVQLVSERYSVSPALLLAVLDYQSGWLTTQDQTYRPYLIGYVDYGWEGLFPQLSWAAEQLNMGFYLWRAGWEGPFLFADGWASAPAPGLNAGTVAIQYLFSILYPYDEWLEVVGPEGFIRTYRDLFGDPFAWSIEPLLPEDLEQPELQLPFEDGQPWSFTGGPHSGWGTGAAWAALDFAPPGFALGCVQSDAWIAAVADAPVVLSDNGAVILDLDGDGYMQTGWTVLYMHVESRDRVPEGEYVRRGDRIGHPSCEGGVSTGTHLHLARRYNGLWIEADGPHPIVMDGWVSAGQGSVYEGTLQRGEEILYSCSCRSEENQVKR